jgi:O-antigen/teichoic acid export membrane protein
MNAPQAPAPEEPGHTAPADPSARNTVARNTMLLVAAQLLSMPLSMLINAVLARKLGPEDFGAIFLANNLVAFGFLVVEWGQAAALTGLIARNRSVAGTALGTGMAWRLGAAVVVYGALATIAWIVDYGENFQTILALVVAARTIGTICAICLDTARGFERSAPTAVSLVRYNILSACLVVPTLYAGGGLYGALVALIAADLINTTLVFLKTRSLNLGGLKVERSMLSTLLQTGTTFMLLGLAVNLQPNVDATMLARLATPEEIGWHAAARKLVGLLIFPATAMVGALYPTLCRLYEENAAEYRRLVATGLRVSTVLVMPVALGTGLFPQLGIMIFSEEAFGPAEDNLRILSLFILLLYVTMVLGSAASAAGKQRYWTITQFACVGISAVVDPFLIPWFQEHAGNGSLGVCVAAVLSEVLMLGCGIYILPKGIFDRAFANGIGRALLAGCAMAGTAMACAGLGPFIAAPASVLTYAAAIYLLGGIDRETLLMLRSIVRRKTGGA